MYVMFMALTFIVFILYGVSASGVRRHVVESTKISIWLQHSFAVTFAAFRIWLAVTDQ